MSRRILNYGTERAATNAMRRLLKRYPVHADCKVSIMYSPSWMYPFRYLIAVHGRDNRVAYWSAKR